MMIHIHFKKGEWAKFEKAEVPIIEKIEIKKSVQKGDEISVFIKTKNSDSILYFLTSSEGENVSSDTYFVDNDSVTIKISPEESNRLGIGANNIKIFATSDSVLKPDFYESSFIVSDNKINLPIPNTEAIEFTENEPEYWFWTIPVILIIIIVAYVKKRNQIKP